MAAKPKNAPAPATELFYADDSSGLTIKSAAVARETPAAYQLAPAEGLPAKVLKAKLADGPFALTPVDAAKKYVNFKKGLLAQAKAEAKEVAAQAKAAVDGLAGCLKAGQDLLVSLKGQV